MKTATIIDLIVDSDVHTQSMNHIIKQHHISQRMRRRLRNEGIITVNNEPATWNTLVQVAIICHELNASRAQEVQPQPYGFRYRL